MHKSDCEWFVFCLFYFVREFIHLNTGFLIALMSHYYVGALKRGGLKAFSILRKKILFFFSKNI